MKTMNRIMLAFDLSDMDKRILQFTDQLVNWIGASKMYCLHVMPDMEFPKNEDLNFHNLFTSKYPVDERVRDKINRDIGTHLSTDDVDIDIEVIEGKPYRKLLRWTQLKEVDLIVVGKKRNSNGSGITAKRVARHTDCNILFVPEVIPGTIQHIMVPIDFSESSVKALQFAMEMKKNANSEINVTAIHIMEAAPVDYLGEPIYDTGFNKILSASAHEAYRRVLDNWQISHKDLTFINVEDCYGGVAKGILEYADVNGVDLVITGAQGHSALNNFLFGSVTEKLVERNKDKPVLIIR